MNNFKIQIKLKTVVPVPVPEQMKKKVLNAGLYLAMIRDDTFTLDVPEGFQPKKFN